MYMSPRFIGIRPDEIIWNVLNMGWAQRIVRRFAVLAGITAAIIFWSFPAAFVGVMSNIYFLADTFPFLSWITKLPAAITGVLQGFAPALALSLLMAAVPWMLRGSSRFSVLGTLVLLVIRTYARCSVTNPFYNFQVAQESLVFRLCP